MLLCSCRLWPTVFRETRLLASTTAPYNHGFHSKGQRCTIHHEQPVSKLRTLKAVAGQYRPALPALQESYTGEQCIVEQGHRKHALVSFLFSRSVSQAKGCLAYRCSIHNGDTSCHRAGDVFVHACLATRIVSSPKEDKYTCIGPFTFTSPRSNIAAVAA